MVYRYFITCLSLPDCFCLHCYLSIEKYDKMTSLLLVSFKGQAWETRLGHNLLPSGSEQHGVLLFGNIQDRILQARQSSNRKNTLKHWYSWVVKIRNTSETGHNTPLCHYTDRGPMMA